MPEAYETYDFTPLVESWAGGWNHITVIGDDDFARSTHIALARIRINSPETYATAVRYIHTIKQETRDYPEGYYIIDMLPVFVVPSFIYNNTNTIFAGDIVHYAIHFRQLHDQFVALQYLFADYDDALQRAWDGLWLIHQEYGHNTTARNILSDAINSSRFEEEQEALRVQIEIMRNFGAPPHEIAGYEAGIGTIWWEPCEGRCFCELDRIIWTLRGN